MAATSQFEELLRLLRPHGIHAGLARVPETVELKELYPEERACVASAIPRRQREYATGRRLARALLGELGIAPGPLPSAGDRSPVWPDAAVGSISHAGGWCAVVVARPERWRSIGIDIESSAALDEELWRIVCTDRERSWLRAQPEELRGKLAKVFFSTKESVYKCQHPLTGKMLGFHQVEVSLDPAGDAFRAEVGPHRVLYRGNLRRSGPLVLALTTAPDLVLGGSPI